VGRLDQLDLTARIGRAGYEERLALAQRRWLQLRLHIGGQMGTGDLGPGLLLVFEGPDAAGKGGAIKRVVEPLDPRHYRVSTFAAPTYDEKRHHFLWRFYRLIPGLRGHVRVRPQLVRPRPRRARGGVREDEQWQRAYDEICGFERTLVLEGVIL
jgi:polyphosphate kinase 2 (PPK2 family)